MRRWLAVWILAGTLLGAGTGSHPVEQGGGPEGACRAALDQPGTDGDAARRAEHWNNAGVRCYQSGLQAEAETLYRRALAAWQAAGDAGNGRWRTVTNLALVLAARGRFAEAESAYREAAEALERRGKPVELATTWNNQAELYRLLGRPNEAVALAHQALALARRHYGPRDSRLASYLHTLATAYRSAGRLDQAALLFEQCRAIQEQAGVEPARTAATLNNLGEIASARHRYEDAERYTRRALELWELALGPQHPRVAVGLNNLAQSLRLQGRREEAEPLYARALAILEDAQGAYRLDLARFLLNVADLYREQERYPRAVRACEHAIALLETHLNPDHPDVALALTRLAEVRRGQLHYAEAARLYRRSLALLERAGENQALAVHRQAYQSLLR